MIQRVFEQASQALTHVFVATDDDRIYNAVQAFGGKAIMTSDKHNSGTDRCAEALEKAENMLNCKFDVVVNIQGDEPFIQPEQIKSLCACFNDTATHIATLVKPFENEDDVTNPNKVKAILDKNKRAIYFSRSPIPYLRNAPDSNWAKHFPYLKHLGIYAYRTDVLRQVTRLPQSSLEKAESLEQNRWIENGYVIRAEITDFESLAVDTPEDLAEIQKKMYNIE
jgi:3-deoxy-manno-octulosonate cytidylyltransferase (CMP-KDO synthetase)